MIKSQVFFNDGFGWLCKHCEEKRREEAQNEPMKKLPRYYREGEAESKKTMLSFPIAKWTDTSHRQLICPVCGVSEIIDQT